MMARDSLWLSVMLIFAAVAAKTIDKRGATRSTFVVVVILAMGGSLVPLTVLRFRLKVRPLLAEYRQEFSQVQVP